MANNDLFATLASDIKSYTGSDPLLPWIRGIRKMKDSLSPQILKEKIPRFLQKCAQTFESDRRYRNDLRYLRVWLQLMDFVDDPRVLLKMMESKSIGTKHSLFYQAYALYYEKSKKFDEAEKMYHLGVQNLAEPADELHKSYDQFLLRMRRHKKRLERINRNQSDENEENKCRVRGRKVSEGNSMKAKPLTVANRTDYGPTNKHQGAVERGSDKALVSSSEDTVVKFFVKAIDGRSEAENACHHGLVEPTINMKEAMKDINSMFSEPLDSFPVGRSRQRRLNNDVKNPSNGFEVFIDEDCDKNDRVENHGLRQEPLLGIFVDEEEEENDKAGDEFEGSKVNDSRPVRRSITHRNAFVFPNPRDLSDDDVDGQGSSRPRFREDTVVCRFVGSAILDEPEVENVCHHGLVDPTINLKEAMEDINNMFGKPMTFVRSKRSKKQEKAPETKTSSSDAFTILADDDLEHEADEPAPKPSMESRGFDLFEPTVVTKEAIDDIKKMFAMPLDF